MAADQIPNPASDHGSLYGLTDDDHLQYTTLALGTLAARPAAGSRSGAVFFYYATDKSEFYISNGVLWSTPIGAGGGWLAPSFISHGG